MIKYLDIKLGYECNNNCKHCVIALQKTKSENIRGNYNRTTSECCNEILESKNNGYNSVVITGGEPLIRKDILEILKYAKELDMQVFLQTNGRLLNDKEFAEKVNEYVDAYTIALHGSSAEIHDVITWAAGSFDETITGLRNIVELGGKVSIKTVISNYNYKDLLNILKTINQLKIKNINIAFPHPHGNAARYFSEVVPKYIEVREFIEECIDYSEKTDINLEFEAVLPCALRKRYDLKYFADFKYWDSQCELKQLDNDTLDWNEVRKEIKRKNDICNKCIYNNRCEGYWMEYVEVRGFNEFNAIEKENYEGR